MIPKIPRRKQSSSTRQYALERQQAIDHETLNDKLPRPPVINVTIYPKY